MAKARTPQFTSTTHPSFDGIISQLRDAGANHIRIVEEDGSGRRYLDESELRLEVEVIYDHWGMQERLRRVIETLDDTVRWNGNEWSFDATIECETPTDRSICVYDRREECCSGDGMSLYRLFEAATE